MLMHAHQRKTLAVRLSKMVALTIAIGRVPVRQVAGAIKRRNLSNYPEAHQGLSSCYWKVLDYVMRRPSQHWIRIKQLHVV